LQRAAIARRILELMELDLPDYGEESWVADVGRYVDRDRFEVEKRKLFLERPQLIALSGDIPDPGDYFATDIAGRPILIVRGKDGVVRTFLNACRHRGARLAAGSGRAGRFTCPFHGWTYGNNGVLVAVPDREAFEPGQLRDLIELHTVERVGVVIVHPQPAAAFDGDEFLGPVQGLLEDMGIADFRLILAYREPARINWKHPSDGNLEEYHAPIVHAKSVGDSLMKQQLHMRFGMHHAVLSPSADIKALRTLPESQWPASRCFTAGVVIFPNTSIGEVGPTLIMMRGEPRDQPGLIDYVIRIYARPAATAEERQAQEAVADIALRATIEEDLPIQVGAQAMMEAGAIESVVFGRKEICLTRIHKAYDELIGLGDDSGELSTAGKAARRGG